MKPSIQGYEIQAHNGKDWYEMKGFWDEQAARAYVARCRQAGLTDRFRLIRREIVEIELDTWTYTG